MGIIIIIEIMLLRNREIKHKKIEEPTDDIIDIINNTCIFIFDFVYKTIKIIINISGIYLLWIFLHHAASQLYVQICVPNTIAGFLMSPFMTATPHCQGLRWLIYNSANMINNMWLVLGAWICSKLLTTTDETN